MCSMDQAAEAQKTQTTVTFQNTFYFSLSFKLSGNWKMFEPNIWNEPWNVPSRDIMSHIIKPEKGQKRMSSPVCWVFILAILHQQTCQPSQLMQQHGWIIQIQIKDKSQRWASVCRTWRSYTQDLQVKDLSPSMVSQRAEVAVCDTWCNMTLYRCCCLISASCISSHPCCLVCTEMPVPCLFLQ